MHVSSARILLSLARCYNPSFIMQVVHGFDLDACRVLFDGKDVWATEAALRALHCRTMLVEPLRQSPSYEYRILKYMQRFGLQLLVPGLHPHIISASFSRAAHRLDDQAPFILDFLKGVENVILKFASALYVKRTW